MSPDMIGFMRPIQIGNRRNCRGKRRLLFFSLREHHSPHKATTLPLLILRSNVDSAENTTQRHHRHHLTSSSRPRTRRHREGTTAKALTPAACLGFDVCVFNLECEFAASPADQMVCWILTKP